MKRPNNNEGITGRTKLIKSDIPRSRDKMSEQVGINTVLSLLEAVGHQQQLKIFHLFQIQTEMNVANIASVLGITDSAVSQHCTSLKIKDR